ncbi:MAG: hypothetical protein HY360_19560 [Verrucomicrobia bacterium]|nr:hypothetical protein [Verrucomicrobiota bacterium]
MNQSSPHFPYRAWSVSARVSWKLLEETIARALQEAPRHGINCIELQDYIVVPAPCWMDAPARFRRFPRLAKADSLHYGGGRSQVSRAERATIAGRLKEVARRVHNAGCELQVWYHCFRDWPDEANEFYPQLKNADDESLYAMLRETIADAFDCFPEINGLTVTSLHETVSIMNLEGKLPRSERILRLYRSILDVCDRYGKRLILRDFIAKKNDQDDFVAVLEQLPNHVIIQTKNVEADWSPHEKPLNPYIFDYARSRKRLVVEFELANNVTGETEMPWADPEQIWRHIRLLAKLNVHGAVGRLVNNDELSAGTIFNTPNEVNVWAFTRTLQEPGRLMQKPSDEWWHDFDCFDASIWTDWARLRFGVAAVPEIIHVLAQTPRLVSLTFNICGEPCGLCVWKTYNPRAEESICSHADRMMPLVLRAIRRCGPDTARSEKTEARRIVETALTRIERLRPIMPADGYANVHGAFVRARHFVAVYGAFTEALLAALDAQTGKKGRPELIAAIQHFHQAGAQAARVYGENFCTGMPRSVPVLAEYLGKFPERLALLAGCATQEAKHD